MLVAVLQTTTIILAKPIKGKLGAIQSYLYCAAISGLLVALYCRNEGSFYQGSKGCKTDYVIFQS